MKANLIFLIAFAIQHGTYAQIDAEQNLKALGNLTPYAPGAIGFDNRYQGIQGDPFLFSEWQDGQVQFAKQDTFSMSIKCNLDLVKQVLVVQMRNGSSSQVTATNIKAIQIKEGQRRWLTLSEKEVENINSVRLKFYELLHQGKYQLLKLTEKSFKKANYQGAYNIGNNYDEFLTETSYWLRSDGNRYTKVKMKRKEIEAMLPGTAAAFIKSEKLDLSEEKDVIKLLTILEASEQK